MKETMSKLIGSYILVDRSVLAIFDNGEVWQMFPSDAKWKKISVDPRNIVSPSGGSVKLNEKDEYGI